MRIDRINIDARQDDPLRYNVHLKTTTDAKGTFQIFRGDSGPGCRTSHQAIELAVKNLIENIFAHTKE